MNPCRPYLLHTNRKLGLMLRGIKPLAMFSEAEGHFPEAVWRYLRMFNRHVATKRLIRHDDFRPPDKWRDYTLHTILFALPGEQWRIAEMLDLRRSEVWSIEHERREGKLLGYADWMNDWHLRRMYPDEKFPA